MEADSSRSGYSHSAECGGPHISLRWPWPRPLRTHTYMVTVTQATAGQIWVLGGGEVGGSSSCGPAVVLGP